METILQRREKGEQVVGVVEETFLFLLDLRGSTTASRQFPDPTDLAKRLSRIYEQADLLVRDYGGYFEKGSGDGLLFTLRDGPGVWPKVVALLMQLETTLGNVAGTELGIRRTIMIAHHGTIFRGVMGSAGRMAWDNCGKDLTNCFDIEKYAKQVDGAVFAASESFLARADSALKVAAIRAASASLTLSDGSERVYVYDSAAREAFRKLLLARIQLGVQNQIESGDFNTKRAA
jgi:class 3 adenylate cyclase